MSAKVTDPLEFIVNSYRGEVLVIVSRDIRWASLPPAEKPDGVPS